MKNEEPADLPSVIHRAFVPLCVSLVAAALLTAFRDEGFVYALGAVLAWLLVILFTAFHVGHRWDVCPRCDQPPKRVATPEARARLARYVHGFWVRQFERLLMWVTLLAVVMPKPYLEGVGGWWRLAPAGAYATVAAVLVRSLTLVGRHKEYSDECHLEWCRANGRRVKVPNWFQRAVSHYGVWVLLVLIPGTIAFGLRSLGQGHFWLQVAYGAALAILFYTLWAVGKFHTGALCLVCADRLPDNGGALAEKRMRWLRLHHVLKVVAPASAAALWVVSWLFPGTVYGRAALGAAGLCLIGWMVLNRMHSRVQPWCPWCRDGDEGEEAEADVPDPSTNQPVPA